MSQLSYDGQGMRWGPRSDLNRRHPLYKSGALARLSYTGKDNNVVSPPGVEPGTLRLKGGSSAIELEARGAAGGDRTRTS